MGIRSFDEWISSSGLRERASMKSMNNATIAIEAEHYLDCLMKVAPTKEPLLSAIGGLPFGLKSHIVNHIGVWRAHGIAPFFVFAGIDGWKQDDTVADAEENGRINSEAWGMYEQGHPQDAVNTFGKSGSVKPKHFTRFLQSILRELAVPFTVAPYSAWAELAYLEKNANGAIDAISGSSECFLFEADKVIVEWDFNSKELFFVRKRDLLENLGNLTSELFVDALLLSGSAILPTLPPVLHQRSKVYTIKAVRDLLMSPPRNGYQVVMSFEDEQNTRRTNYIERYRKARIAVKHHTIATMDGRLQMLNESAAPYDVHQVMGQRLPDELYFYLSKGVVGSRLLNMRTTGVVLELPPLAGGEYDAYRSLVSEKLISVRQATQGLLSCSLHRFFQRGKDENIRCWFDTQDIQRPLRIQEFVDDHPSAQSFSVRAETFAEVTQKLTKNGLLGIITLSLNDQNFVSKSITKKDPKTYNPLVHKDEIMFNSLWRVLLLRGFVDSQHKFTPWGKVLAAALSALDGNDTRLEESVFLAVELARLGLLTPDDIFKDYRGVPYRGSDTDKRNTLLVSRVACFSQLEHDQIGFTGPLSRGLLAYHSMICTVRDTLRDLTESCISTLLLAGDANRDRKDFTEMGLDLPFLHHNDCGLGIAVVSYLDELVGRPEPRTQETKKAVWEKGPTEWFPHSKNYVADLDRAFGLFNAVYEGVKAGGTLFKQRQIWDEAHEWLQGLIPNRDT